jgi:hypothetical protein
MPASFSVQALDVVLVPKVLLMWVERVSLSTLAPVLTMIAHKSSVSISARRKSVRGGKLDVLALTGPVGRHFCCCMDDFLLCLIEILVSLFGEVKL